MKNVGLQLLSYGPDKDYTQTAENERKQDKIYLLQRLSGHILASVKNKTFQRQIVLNYNK